MRLLDFGTRAARQHQRLGTVGSQGIRLISKEYDIELEVVLLEAPSLYMYEVKGHVYIRESDSLLYVRAEWKYMYVMHTFIHAGIRRYDTYMHMYILS